jgi:hypothetical protein
MDTQGTQQPTAEELVKQLESVSSYLKVLNTYLKKKLDDQNKKTDK